MELFRKFAMDKSFLGGRLWTATELFPYQKTAQISIDWNELGKKLGLIYDLETTCICDAAAFHAEMRSYAEF